VTAQGDSVLDTAGRAITAADGKVDPRRVGVVALTNPRKEGDNLVTGTPAGAAAGTVRSGALESSGADAARSMVDMIASMRAFEAGQKVIQTIDETLGQAVTKVGAVGG
jgi:flagellar basal-body rod protein FlgG